MSQIGCTRFRMDQPNGMPRVDRRPYRVALSQDEVAHLLIGSSHRLLDLGCDDPDCEACNGFRACWWDLYNELPRAVKLSVARTVAYHGWELPDAPWEVEA